MSPIIVTVEGISKLIHGLKLSTSCGVDNINSKVLKNTSASSSQILCHIFQQSLSSGQLPTDWKIAKVIPIFKDGNKHTPGNYRPISLTCICCKLLEHIITSHIYSHLESNNFFLNQHGFRKALSCDTQLLEFTSDLHNGMNSNKIVDCIFLDYAKAFDRVAHCRLIAKLSALKLDSSTLSWLRNFCPIDSSLHLSITSARLLHLFHQVCPRAVY
uniref:Putative endonuclease/reverse transcriptase n=1 Tax=Rhipicephalus microplus TaxID=6941 RepID=A0A6G5ABZ4_RHIMP